MSIKQNGGVFGRNPTFRDVNVENDLSVSGSFSADTASFTGNVDLGDNDRLRLGAGSDLQIYHDGTRNYIDASSETRLRSSSFTLRDSANYIFFATASNNAGNYSLTMYANDTPSMKFQGGSIVAYENIVFNSAGDGIDFSATSGTGTSELFDDYEEGYHVVTATPETSGTLTLDTAFDRDTFRYTKIGQRVFVSGCLQFLSVASPVGTWFSVSLPFAVANVGGLSDRSAGVAWQENTGTTAAVTLDNGQSVAKVRINASTVITGGSGRVFINFDYVT